MGREQFDVKQLPLFSDPVEALPEFDGETYDHDKDHTRLGAQLLRVWTVMADGRWRSLRDIAAITMDPEASISARLRDLRKEKFGGLDVERRRRADAGTWEYRLI